MVGHLALPKLLHMAMRWGGKGTLMGCTRRTTGPTGTLPLPTEDQTHTHTHSTVCFISCSFSSFIYSAVLLDDLVGSASCHPWGIGSSGWYHLWGVVGASSASVGRSSRRRSSSSILSCHLCFRVVASSLRIFSLLLRAARASNIHALQFCVKVVVLWHSVVSRALTWQTGGAAARYRQLGKVLLHYCAIKILLATLCLSLVTVSHRPSAS